ncbi:MAG TPA: acyl-CoA dehydrogenase family protein [Kofleriaceae bacterium]|nr:acyl-CoA dehydrogenase family protein [Kofleriaceae bacterium]
MDFAPTEDQRLIQRTAREFAERTLAPRAAERDARAAFPTDELRALGALGLLGITVPEAHGGAGAGAVAYALVMQELARGDASVALLCSLTNMVGELIATRGSAALAARWVPRLVSGDGDAALGAFALSEPDAGSDPSAMRTLATRTADGWQISGTKQWITAGDRAGCIVVWAATQAGGRGITAFVVPGDAPGITVARHEDKLGLRATTTTQLVFDRVTVGDDAVLGHVGAGFALAMLALDGGRIGVAALAIGIARGAFEAALRYACTRETFGQPIIEHQAIGAMLADAATWLDAASLLTARAAQLKQARKSYAQAAAMAKLFATEHAWKICDAALQIHGGYGYVRDFPVERALRDVRVTRIFEDTSEIQRLVIARNLLLGALR